MLTKEQAQAKRAQWNAERLARHQSIEFPLDPKGHVTRLIQADNEENWNFLGTLICHAVAGVNIIPVKQYRKEPEEYVEGKGWVDSDEIKQIIHAQPEGSEFLLFPTHCYEDPRLYLPSDSGKGDYSFPVRYTGREGWGRENFYSSVSYGFINPSTEQSLILEMGTFVGTTPNGGTYKYHKFRMACGSLNTEWFRRVQFVMTHWHIMLKQLREAK